MEIPKEDRIDFIRIKDFISLCILNWKWFVVSILLITSMGVVYVLRSPSVFSRTMTPAYYLQQNDIVYVEPGDVRANQSTVNGNTIRSTSFWISVTSLIASLISIFL